MNKQDYTLYDEEFETFRLFTQKHGEGFTSLAFVYNMFDQVIPVAICECGYKMEISCNKRYGLEE